MESLWWKINWKEGKGTTCDDGGEYTSSEFAAYLTKEGIKQKLTALHTPQLNSMAGSLNWMLIEGVCTMLPDEKLPHRFWVEALSMCVYLRNSSPTKLLSGITLFEALYGNYPLWSMVWCQTKCQFSLHLWLQCLLPMHLKSWKAQARPHARQESVSCLGMVLLRKGIICIILTRMKVIHSRDTAFDQDSMPGIQKSPLATV